MEIDGVVRARLTNLVVMDEWKALQSMLEDEVRKFQDRLINTNPANKNEVLANHAMAKAASQVYIGFINRLNAEIELYRKSPKTSDKPEDVTEGVLDLGDITRDLPNFFESEEGDFDL